MVWRLGRSNRDKQPEPGGRLQQLVDAGDTRELARRAMTLQALLLDLHRQLASVGSQEELARTMALALTGSFACERIVVLRAATFKRRFDLMARVGDSSEELQDAAPRIASELAPFLPHLAPLVALDAAVPPRATLDRCAKLGISRAAWLNVDGKVDWIVLIGPKFSRAEYDEFDRSLLQATFDAATLACSRLLLVDVLQERNQQLGEANTRLLHIDDLKSAILTGVSHELRTPLTRIVSYSEALEDTEIGAEERAAFAKIILNSARHLAAQIDGALTFAELIGGRTVPAQKRTELHQVVEAVAQGLKPIASERGVSLSYRCDPHVAVTDPDYVRSIIKNLIDNALKFTPRGGRVEAELVAEGAGASILVRDNGPGIPEGARERIWRLFELGDTSLRREASGLGLGLALAQRLAVELDVELGLVQSGPQGTLFRVHFADAAPTGVDARATASELVPVHVVGRAKT